MTTAPEWLAAAVRELQRIAREHGGFAASLDIASAGPARFMVAKHTPMDDVEKVYALCELRPDGQVVVVRDRDGLLGEVVR